MPISSGFGRGIGKFSKFGSDEKLDDRSDDRVEERASIWTVRKKTMSPTVVPIDAVSHASHIRDDIGSIDTSKSNGFADQQVVRYKTKPITSRRYKCCGSKDEGEMIFCCDCCRCAGCLKDFESMCGCPIWFYILALFAFGGLIIGLVLLTYNPATVTITKTIVQYLGLVSQYSTITDYTYTYYIDGPCIPPSAATGVTAYPLCNKTTTRMVTNVNVQINNNLYNPIAPPPFNEAQICFSTTNTIIFFIIQIILLNFIV